MAHKEKLALQLELKASEEREGALEQRISELHSKNREISKAALAGEADRIKKGIASQGRVLGLPIENARGRAKSDLEVELDAKLRANSFGLQLGQTGVSKAAQLRSEFNPADRGNSAVKRDVEELRTVNTELREINEEQDLSATYDAIYEESEKAARAALQDHDILIDEVSHIIGANSETHRRKAEIRRVRNEVQDTMSLEKNRGPFTFKTLSTPKKLYRSPCPARERIQSSTASRAAYNLSRCGSAAASAIRASESKTETPGLDSDVERVMESNLNVARAQRMSAQTDQQRTLGLMQLEELRKGPVKPSSFILGLVDNKDAGSKCSTRAPSKAGSEMKNSGRASPVEPMQLDETAALKNKMQQSTAIGAGAEGAADLSIVSYSYL